ncbi:MAG: BrxE family protein [Cyanobacteriota bacterium]
MTRRKPRLTPPRHDAPSWDVLTPHNRHPLDFRQLFKLRLVMAALGETQRLGLWNSGVLTGTGEFLFQQGFPRCAPFAQTRAGFRGAQLACDEALAIQHTPGGPIICHLFRLPPQLEDACENKRNRWLDEPQQGPGCLKRSWSLKTCSWHKDDGREEEV